jgi:hypothetical protein
MARHDSQLQRTSGGMAEAECQDRCRPAMARARRRPRLGRRKGWASGAPTGLLHDPWNVRLIPHYSLAPLFVISHLAVGLRTVLLGHDVRVAVANRLAWVVFGTGLGISLATTIAQLSVGR